MDRFIFYRFVVHLLIMREDLLVLTLNIYVINFGLKDSKGGDRKGERERER